MDRVNETKKISETLTHKIQDLSKFLKPREIAQRLNVSANEVRVIRSRLKKRGELPKRVADWNEEIVWPTKSSRQWPYQIKKNERMMAMREATNPQLMELLEKMDRSGIFFGFKHHERIATLPPEAQQYLIEHPDKIFEVSRGKIILRLIEPDPSP